MQVFPGYGAGVASLRRSARKPLAGRLPGIPPLRQSLRRVGAAFPRLEQAAGRDPARTLVWLLTAGLVAAGLAVIGRDRLELAGTGPGADRLTVEVRGTDPVSAPGYEVALQTMRFQLRADPGVAAVRQGRTSPDGRSTSLVVTLSGDGNDRVEALDRIEQDLDPGPLRTAISGQTPLLEETRKDVTRDLRLLLLAVPLAALTLGAALGIGGALSVALAAFAASAFGAAVAVGAGLLTEVSQLAVAGAAVAGIAGTLHLCALTASGLGGRTVLLAATAAAAVFAALAVVGVDYLGSIAVGASAAFLAAGPAAFLATTAARAAWPPRDPGGTAERLWRRGAALVGRRRLISIASATLAVAVLLLLASPGLDIQTVAFGTPAPPDVAPATLLGAIALAMGLGCAVLLAAGRSPSLAAIGVAAAALPALACAGILVFLFGEGHLEGPLGFTSREGVSVSGLATAVATVAALGALRGAALLGAARSPRPGVIDPYLAAQALTGPPLALGALLTASGAATLAGSDLLFLKEFGLGVAAGTLLDLVLCRALLVPALLRMLGPK